MGGEFKRGYDRDVAAAGTCLSRFDARPFIDGIDVPCASVVTERDRLVRAKEQLDLAEALHAPVFVVDGDHDTPLVRPKEFSTAVADAVDSVAQRAAGDWEAGGTAPAAGRAQRTGRRGASTS